ncbi:hypothetical protein Bbelb_027540 [Branchiostoma belcheri]|nr:hypothetical protein Bbelb_027540 [Branchiostoma belcheri]
MYVVKHLGWHGFQSSAADGSKSLMDILHHLSSTADRRGTLSSIVLTDFSKAFDRVEHTTAISRLLELGCRPSLTRWICDFLSERRQRVLYQGSLSEWEILPCGLPQGTVLAPIIFIAMINSAAVKTRSTNWKFVDDLSMIESRLTREPSLLQHDLNDLEQWTANILYIDGHALQEVTVAKLLGVMVQSDLKWNMHVNHITSQSSRRLFLLRHLKRFRLPVTDLVTVYVSYVRPLCEYACPVWGPGLTSTQTTQIENIQRRACRIILGKDYSRYSDACSLLGLPSLQQRRQHLILKFGRGLMESPTFRQWLPSTRGETSEAYPIEEKDNFFEKLDGSISSVPDTDNLVVMGDLNGRVGKRRPPWESYLGPHSDTTKKCSFDGEQLLALCAEHDLWIANTFFQHRESQTQAWYKWNNLTVSSQIDFILTRRKHRKTVVDTRAIPNAEMDRDHRPVILITRSEKQETYKHRKGIKPR